MNLLDLPNELLIRIIHQLCDNKPALCKICLLGNHRLLAIARPLSLHIVHCDWDGCTLWNHDLVRTVRGDNAADPLQLSLESLSKSEQHAQYVRCFQLVIRHTFEIKNISSSLPSSLSKFTNLSHLSIEFDCVPYYDNYSQDEEDKVDGISPFLGIFLRVLGGSLTHLHLRTCNFEEDYLITDDLCPPPLPLLKHLSLCTTSGCSVPLVKLWDRLPALQTLELQDVPTAHTSTSFNSQASILRDAFPGEASPFSRIARLNRLLIMCNCDEDPEDSMDDYHYGSTSRQCGNAKEITTMLCETPESSPSSILLEELILLMHLDPKDFLRILDSCSLPNLRKLRIGSSTDILDWRTEPRCSTANKKPGRASFANFPQLTYLWLPTAGTRSKHMMEYFNLTSNTKLKCLIFDSPLERSSDKMPLSFNGLAKKYGQKWGSLKVVAWNQKHIVRLSRKRGDPSIIVRMSLKSWNPSIVRWASARDVGYWVN